MGLDKHLQNIENLIEKILDEKDLKNRKKLDKRISRLNEESGITGLIEKRINGDKFILSVYFLTVEIVAKTSTRFPPALEEIFQFFLDAENDSSKTDAEVLKLRKSGEKQGKKIFATIQKLGYYEK